MLDFSERLFRYLFRAKLVNRFRIAPGDLLRCAALPGAKPPAPPAEPALFGAVRLPSAPGRNSKSAAPVGIGGGVVERCNCCGAVPLSGDAADGGGFLWESIEKKWKERFDFGAGATALPAAAGGFLELSWCFSTVANTAPPFAAKAAALPECAEPPAKLVCERAF